MSRRKGFIRPGTPEHRHASFDADYAAAVLADDVETVEWMTELGQREGFLQRPTEVDKLNSDIRAGMRGVADLDAERVRRRVTGEPEG